MTTKKRPVKKRPAKTTSTKTTPAKKIVRGFLRGSEGRENVDVELKNTAARKEKRAKEMNKPFRFWMKDGEENREIIILDDPDFFMYEHRLKDPATGRFDHYVSCCQSFTECAVCLSSRDDRHASYNMVLTCLDLEPYTTRAGATIPYSRKLYIVKQGQHKKFMRLYTKHGTLRGARFILARDGDKSSAIGSDIEFDGFVDEDELATYVREFTDREGKVHTEDCSVPFIYEEVFDAPDPQELRDLVPGSAPPPGSKEANEEEPVRTKRASSVVEEDEEEEEFEDEDQDEEAWEEEEEDEVEDEEEDEEDEEEDDIPFEKDEPEDEEDESEEDEEEEELEEEEPEPEPEPKRKPRRKSAVKEAPKRKTRRATRR